jgi:hypothetical protein
VDHAGFGIAEIRRDLIEATPGIDVPRIEETERIVGHADQFS